jgi:hypothetical protein
MQDEQKKALETIRRLIALVGDDQAALEERRTAAFTAVMLMQKHELSVCTAEVAKHAVLDDVLRGAPTGTTTPAWSSKRRAVTFQSLGRVQCQRCQQPVPKGDWVQWVPGVGCWHPLCWDMQNDEARSAK